MVAPNPDRQALRGQRRTIRTLAESDDGRISMAGINGHAKQRPRPNARSLVVSVSTPRYRTLQSTHTVHAYEPPMARGVISRPSLNRSPFDHSNPASRRPRQVRLGPSPEQIQSAPCCMIVTIRGTRSQCHDGTGSNTDWPRPPASPQRIPRLPGRSADDPLDPGK